MLQILSLKTIALFFIVIPLALYSQSKDSLVNLANGITKFNEGNYEAAEIEFRKAIEKNPKISESHFYLGEIYQIQNENKKAMEHYNLSIESDSTNSKAFKGRGKLKAKFEDIIGSIEDFDVAIKLDKSFTDAYFNRGLSYLSIKEYKSSISDFSKVISLNPKDYQAYVQRGTAKFQMKDNKGACKDWSKAGELGYFDIYETIKKNCK